jgi:uncharacterized protein with NRDE domain
MPSLPPLLLFANRDEAFDRPSSPPSVIEGDPPILAPRDLEAGGTWLGVNAHGVVAALTNRPHPPADRILPSRGLLVLRALRHREPGRAVRSLKEDLERAPTNPFNLLVANGEEAHWLRLGEGLEHRRLEPGIHTLTNDHDLDRLPWRGSPEGEGWRSASQALDEALALLRDHGEVYPEYPLCKHGEAHGTVSAAYLVLGTPASGDLRLAYAAGPPCRIPFTDYSDLLRDLLGRSA